MNTVFLLVVLFSGQADVIEFRSADQCVEAQVSVNATLDKIKARSPETRATAVCLPKLTGPNKAT
jgi:hypothetical protein